MGVGMIEPPCMVRADEVVRGDRIRVSKTLEFHVDIARPVGRNGRLMKLKDRYTKPEKGTMIPGTRKVALLERARWKRQEEEREEGLLVESPHFKPTVGRIVHFWMREFQDSPLEERAAIIVKVHNESKVNLTVYSDNGEFQSPWPDVAYSSEPQEGFWTWPARV
jgi:hypothetical protein